MKIIQILSRSDGGKDVIFEEDGRVLACQVYDTKDFPQRFTWNYVNSILEKGELPEKPLIDQRTPEEINEERIQAIEFELQRLDMKIPRIVEDLVAAVAQMRDIQFSVAPDHQAILGKKADLRNELAILKQERTP
jgi:hypothetical protein